MNGGQREGAGLPLSGFALLVAIMGVVYWQNVPLKSLRPEAPQAPLVQTVLGGEVVRARLWQDPFAAAEQYRQALRAQTVLPQGASQVTAEQSDVQLHSISGLRNDIKKALSESDAGVTILAANVFGGPYSEQAELRLRWRYAVLSGLGASDYVAADSGHIGYIETCSDCANPALDDRLRYPELIPYEWLTPTLSGTAPMQPLVLLLWINDDELSRRPLESILTLMSELDPRTGDDVQDSERKQFSGKLHRKLLGPAGSGNLKAMLGELCAETKDEPRQARISRLRNLGNGLEVFSATATAEEQRLLKTYLACEKKSSIAALFKEFLEGNVKFLRTIATDNSVARQLISELSQRRVIPGVDVKKGFASSCSKNKEPADQGSQNLAHVVFVSEWDTVYGRALPKTIEELFARQAESVQGLIPPEDTWAHRFSYLRGMDGQLPGVKKPTQQKNNNQSENGENSESERSVGRGQFDYLRRLAGSVKKLGWELRDKCEGRVRTIGVLGSDYYDKQLVLQALRPMFENAVFFTTDIDARLTHKADLAINRNLLVASSYGLSLARDVQREIPPFRDGYQTSLFFATRLAVDSETNKLTQEKIDAWIQPRVFEISRDGVYDFGLPPIIHRENPIPFKSGKVAQLYPTQPRYFGTGTQRGHVGIILLISLILIFTFSTEVKSGLWQTLVWCRANLGFASILLGFLVWLGWKSFCQYQAIVTSDSGEPFSFSSGISAWPTTLIRVLAAVLAFYYLIWMWWNLKTNAIEISAWIRSPGGKVEEEPPSILESVLGPFRVVHNFYKALRNWLRDMWLKLQGTYTSGKKSRSNVSAENLGGEVSIGKRLWRGWMELTIHHWRTKHDSTETVSIDTLWIEYQCRARMWKRILRSLIPFVIYFILIVMIIRISEPPNIPVRGLGEGPQKWVFFVPFLASFLLLNFLTFFVVDASRLCRKFISLLTNLNIKWTGPLLEKEKVNLGIENSSYLVEWLNIQVIASRGNVVNKLIYYPFIVLLLLILARLSYFDSWNVPLGLGVSYLLIAGYALYSAIILHRAAKVGRQTALDLLNDKLIRVCSKSNQDECSPAQVKSLIARITNLQQGAFVPISQQPIVRVMLLPLGGLGLALLDYLAWIQ